MAPPRGRGRPGGVGRRECLQLLVWPRVRAAPAGRRRGCPPRRSTGSAPESSFLFPRKQTVPPDKGGEGSPIDAEDARYRSIGDPLLEQLPNDLFLSGE